MTLTLSTPEPIPQEARLTVAFRWKMSDEAHAPMEWTKASDVRVKSFSTDLRSVTITATVPDLPWSKVASGAHPKPRRLTEGLGLVPLTVARLTASKPDGTLIAEVETDLGITSVPLALVVTVVAALLSLGVLSRWSKRRLDQQKLQGIGPILRIVTSERRYGSLSQFQIMLWTFVVGASALYVLVLTGGLIEITGGTLVLLGISGAATVAATLKTTRAESAAQGQGAAPPAPAPDPAAPAAGVQPPQPGGAPADPAQQPLPVKSTVPEWSDLIVSMEWVKGGIWDASHGKWVDGRVTTVDVARVQMLIFTLTTAAFVVVRVITSNAIPPVPDGFVTLMGISNGVYVTSKFAKP
ncbi:MAG TPA: hypothetical protein VMT19_02795 [Thermoanaerobaculaceae bacterium]|nr:hypothetical protein [Thermoanaerobaculaceae bacterium]